MAAAACLFRWSEVKRRLKPSRTFLSDKEQVLILAVTAMTCSCRPSQLMGILEPTIAQAFDVEVALELEARRIEERLETEKRQLEILAAATNVALTEEALR